MKKNLIVTFLSLVSSLIAYAQTDTIVYHLTIEEKTVNFTGKDVRAMVINNSIPGPVLIFKEGQYAVIFVKNKMKEETSVHWHGLLLPSFQDGVPYLNSPPIKSGSEFKFEFPIKQSGTYWYHSHTGLQEQRGVYGSIVIEPKEQTLDYDYDLTVVLSDWTNENPDKVLKTLKRGSEWYSIEKGTSQSLNRVLKHNALRAQFKMWKMRMPGMDISDVYFDTFLSNGRNTQDYKQFKPGDKVRLRVVNAAASTYFWLNLGGKDLEIVSADGKDVVPVSTDKLLIAIAETYDFIVTVPENNSVEFRATAQDGTGNTSIFLGNGEPIYATDIPMPDLIERMKMMADMDMSKNKTDSMSLNDLDYKNKMPGMAMGSSKKETQKFSYDILRSPYSTVMPSKFPLRKVELNLTGNMWRYIWSMNGKTLSEVDKIKIKKGERVQIVLNNKTMMHHPMHLHGHFFRVINKQGDYSPLKHTVDVPPMNKVVIEFEANEQDDWFFHCHILYHMKSGMARVFSYEGSIRDSRLSGSPLKEILNTDKHWYSWGEATLASHMAGVDMVLSNTRNQIIFEGEYGWNTNMETTLFYERFIGDYFRVYGGVDIENKNKSTLDNMVYMGRAGIRWLLPYFIDADFSIDHEMRPQLSLKYNILLFPRLEFFGKWEWQNDFGIVNDLGNGTVWEQEHTLTAGLEYIISKNFSVMGSYDSRFGAGVGLFYRF